MPTPPAFQSSEEAHAFFNSPEWQVQARQAKNFAFVVQADGFFMVDSIPPGNYSLTVIASKAGTQPWKFIPVAHGTLAVTIPDSADPNSPIQLDEIILKP